ncbi:FAD:protein FMN transferase [Roseibacterium beibuensis]|uniref:FAD:protein FMN transferase n=1 Tax=[Roseibacterium] beibuensis TaxID=1193142 RepID=A0ABP9LJ84_9RHOB|nr:FAD:protein FMN transferase [Roseibacterium beibuensis]MCS6623539.1 FAD:protein FMN transferase [Roseibacterium beibuensis]
MTRAVARRLAMGGLLVLAVLVTGALRLPRDQPPWRETLYVFGTLVEIEIRGEDPAVAQAATAEVGRMLQQMHDDWHAWRPGMLGDLNTAIAEGRTFDVDPALAEVLRQGRALSCASGGLFEPAIGGLIALWGFHADTPPHGAPPTPADIAALRDRAPRMSDLDIDGTRITSCNPAVQLDLGGFAKGAALDMAAAALAAQGIQNAVLNAGGDVNVMGAHGARPWRVAIRDPFAWGAVAAVSLQPGEVLFTSGNYERYFDHDGQRFAHILDPRSGAPVSDIVSVSVLDTNGARADAAATALSVAGRDDWPRVARDMGVVSVMMIADDGEIMLSPAMAARLDRLGDTRPVRVVALPDPRPLDCAAP